MRTFLGNFKTMANYNFKKGDPLGWWDGEGYKHTGTVTAINDNKIIIQVDAGKYPHDYDTHEIFVDLSSAFFDELCLRI